MNKFLKLSTSVIVIITLATSSQILISQNIPEVTLENKVLQAPDALHNLLTYPVLFHQTSAEYRALCYQAFNAAKTHLESILPNRPAGEKWAIITDVDETMVDNSYMEAMLVKKGLEYNSKFWREWVEMAVATEIPGAVDFMKWAASKGIEIFYVSNRKVSDVPPTLKNLKNLGFPFADEAHTLFMDKVSSKEIRRDLVSGKFKLVMLMGDNLNDFSNVFEKRNVADRLAEVDKTRSEWGSRFIVIPNAIYGEWESALYDYNRNLTPEQKNAKLLEKLKAY